jgi:hypothetical protein
MTDALETLARELEGKARVLADFPQSLMHKEALQMLAAAACVREAASWRSVEDEQSVLANGRGTHDAHYRQWTATDAALAAFMEGR